VSPPSLVGLMPGSSEPGIFYCLSYLRRIIWHFLLQRRAH